MSCEKDIYDFITQHIERNGLDFPAIEKECAVRFPEYRLVLEIETEYEGLTVEETTVMKHLLEEEDKIRKGIAVARHQMSRHQRRNDFLHRLYEAMDAAMMKRLAYATVIGQAHSNRITLPKVRIRLEKK